MESMHAQMMEERQAMMREQARLREELQAFQQQKLDFENQQKLMHEQFMEQMKKQQEAIENLQQNKNPATEFTVPQKPVRKQASTSGFKVFSEDNTPDTLTLDDTKALLQCGSGSVSGTSGLVSGAGSQHKTPPRIEFNRMLSEPSPTINTKEARMLVNQMWSEQRPKKPEKFEVFQDTSVDIAQPPEKISLKPRGKPKPTLINDEENTKPKFEVYDENTKPKFEVFDENSKPKPKIEIFDENSKPKFEVYDENSKPKIEKPKPKFETFDENTKPKLEVFEDKPSKFQVYQDSQKVEHYDEENPKTMFIPSLEDFKKMATAASTPFNGRGFIPDEDENTCAVDLVFKKPTLPQKKTENPTENGADIQPLSPIMETSRENYKSSSSSSNASQSHFTKSHWGKSFIYITAVCLLLVSCLFKFMLAVYLHLASCFFAFG